MASANAAGEAAGAATLFRFVFLKRECDCSFWCKRSALGGQSCEFVGREAFAQECGETVVRRRLGELALESVSRKRGVGVAFEHSRARKIAAQRDGERQMLDRHRDVDVVRLVRGMDSDRLASCRNRARKIVHRDEIAREIDEQEGEHACIVTSSRRGSVSRTIAIARCV